MLHHAQQTYIQQTGVRMSFHTQKPLFWSRQHQPCQTPQKLQSRVAPPWSSGAEQLRDGAEPCQTRPNTESAQQPAAGHAPSPRGAKGSAVALRQAHGTTAAMSIGR
jgi:hypothetical protein